MWLTALSWLTGSAIGRKVAIYAIVAVVVLVVVLRIYNAGKKASERKALERRLKVLKERIEVDEEIKSLPMADRRERLAKWVRD